MQSLLIGYWKPIRGKGLSKNRPTCENAVSQRLYGSCTLRVTGSWFNSFPASASGTTVLLKTPAKLNYSRNNNATKNYTNVYHICRAWYNGSANKNSWKWIIIQWSSFFIIFSLPSSWHDKHSIFYIYRARLKLKKLSLFISTNQISTSNNLLRTVSK